MAESSPAKKQAGFCQVSAKRWLPIFRHLGISTWVIGGVGVIILRAMLYIFIKYDKVLYNYFKN